MQSFSKILIAFCFVCGVAFGTAVRIAPAYDGRCIGIVEADDMNNVNGLTRWTQYISLADLCASNKIMLGVAVMAGNVTGSWDQIQSRIDGGYFYAGNHSWKHPVNITNYTLEYQTARDYLFTNLDYPASHTYAGTEYMAAMYQWGGCTNLDWSEVDNQLRTNDYLMYRYPGGIAPRSWPAWSATSNLFSYLDSSDVYTRVLDNSYTNYVNRSIGDNTTNGLGVYHIIFHPWYPDVDPDGTNSAVWRAYFPYLASRKEICWTDCSSAAQYQYIRTNNVWTVTVGSSSNKLNRQLSVTADHAARVKYGLSAPVTLIVSVDTNFNFNGGYDAYYRDSLDTDWTKLTVVTTNDMYGQVACVRNDGTNLFISSASSQTTDVHFLQIVPKKKAIGFGL